MENTFNRNIIPANESQRLEALEYYEVICDLPDKYFTNLAHVIATTFNTKIALVSIVAEEDVYFKGNFGMEDIEKVDRGKSLCSLAILDAEPTVYTDALKEPCLLNNPLVIGDFGLRFYAGAPIITKQGFSIGTVCVVDKEPREFSQREKDLLVLFAENAMMEIEMRGKMKRGALAI